MALEDAIVRLARAVELQGEASAVAEIIRQRNAAQKEAGELRQSRDYYERRMSEEYEAGLRLNRQITALRAVVTRMKNKAAAATAVKEAADA